MRLALISDDKLLFDVIKSEFKDIIIDDSLDDINKNNIIIFDGIAKEEIDNILNKITEEYNKLIININNFLIKRISVINITKPFKLSYLIDKIYSFFDYFKKNIVTLPIGIINKNTKTLTIDNKIIKFTEKELEFLLEITNNNNKNKDNLLKTVWGSKSIESNVLETTVYNIRKKLLQNEVKDFIVCENGIYSIYQSYENKL